ncbi:hypothetical protein L1987_63138 [Smallanthus sonchifolius]|uniref:Uncharacterized protein n=1 Tax=Smallanthus sonchifolius TaxID=185202 RepID=A0ACB9CCM3_9ASTR|nr:hypothetical protein L1987_63138 [Smallanthus sonchifolius]
MWGIFGFFLLGEKEKENCSSCTGRQKVCRHVRPWDDVIVDEFIGRQLLGFNTVRRNLDLLSFRMSIGELASTYACLILSDDGIPITAEKIATILKAAKVECESYWPSLFAKLAEKKNIEDLIVNVGAGGGGGGGAPAVAAPAAGGGAAAAAPPEEKKEEPKEESDDDMGFSLFD